jgi:hypothetical protein
MAPVNRALMLEDIHTLNLLSCFKVTPAYETIASTVFAYINAFNTEGATKILYGKKFVENRLKHLTSMHHDKKLEDLQNRFAKVPALIIAAGPSLDKNIDQIHKAVGRAVIICVDTALPNLLEHGITPDFVTSIDYQELTYEKIAGVASHPACRQTNLICTSWVTDMVPKVFPFNTVFWAFNNHALENWMNVSMGGRLAVGGAGTVAHLNFIAATTMGCDPIIFAGQDLAYSDSDSRSHAGNVFLRSDETIRNMLDTGKEVMWVKGVMEPKVPTNRVFYGHKNMFEKLIKKADRQVINATEGGAFIEGTKVMPLAAAVDAFCTSPLKLDTQSIGKPVDLLQPVETTFKQLVKIEKLARKVGKTAKPVQQKLAGLQKRFQNITRFSDLPRDIQEKVSVFDKYQKKIDKDPIWEIFDELTMENLRQDERQKMEINALADTPEKYLEWLSKSVDRVDKINTIRMENLEWFQTRLNELISYYKTEKTKIGYIAENKISITNVLELAHLYEQTKNYVLLGKILDTYAHQAEKEKPSAVLQYYRGIIALYQEDHETAQTRFDLAARLDTSLIPKIADKRKQLGEYYRNLAISKNSTLTGHRSPVVENLLLKGLKCCPDHARITDTFQQFIKEDLEKAGQGLEKDQDQRQIKRSLQKWIDRFEAQNGLFDFLDKSLISDCYGFYGKILINEKKFQGAIDSFKKARAVNPQDPDICIALVDVCFTVSDFDAGLIYLKEAVTLDKQYAVYWYNIGKNLFAQNDFSGAVVAYENYFNALPENYGVLKEIGDCYQALGQLEAAREAYQQFKKHMSKSKNN